MKMLRTSTLLLLATHTHATHVPPPNPPAPPPSTDGTCPSPGLTVPSFAAYIAKPGDPELCMSLYNTACPSAAGITASVVALDPFLFRGFPNQPLPPSMMTADGMYLTDSARDEMCNASRYTKTFNIPVAGKWVFMTSWMQVFCHYGVPVDGWTGSQRSWEEQMALAKGPYDGPGGFLRSLEAEGAVGVTSFNLNFTLVDENEAATCQGTSTMAVTYTNLTHYHLLPSQKTGAISYFMAAHAERLQGNPHVIRIPTAPATLPGSATTTPAAPPARVTVEAGGSIRISNGGVLNIGGAAATASN